MMKQFFNKIMIFNIILICYLVLVQPKYCNYSELYLNNSLIGTELSEELLNKLIKVNNDKINSESLLYLFEEEYQILIFTNSYCTNMFLLNESYFFQNSLHLFSINGTIENDHKFIKVVIQTKKLFNILYYYLNGTKLHSHPDKNQVNYTITTNIYPYYINILFLEEYYIFKNESINVFNESEKIFTDICYIYKTRYETKSPELRKHLYYYKYNNKTYPLLESKDNCIITNTSISYENKSFLLEYTCKRNFNISPSKIQIFNISILSKEEKEKYNGTNSLKDQENILYCNKETYYDNAIKKNAGFYISLCLLFIVFICLIVLIIQKYDIAQKTQVDSPPKKKNPKNDTVVKTKKKVNFNGIEILESKKPKKKNKSKSMIDSNKNNDNDDNNSFNNDLEWYSNNIIDDDNNNTEEDNNNEINNYNSYNNNKELKTKKKKKGKKKKGKKKKKTVNDENDEEKAKSDDENMNYSYNEKKIFRKNNDNNNNNNDNDKKMRMNKTISQFPHAYNKLKENSANQIKKNLHLRRLVIITNLGKNLEENNFNFNKNRQLQRSGIINQNNNQDNNKNENNNNNNDVVTNDNFMKKSSVLPMIRDNLIDEGKSNRNKIINKLVGLENDSFLSNITRDYLKYKDAIIFDNRDYCSIYSHFLRLKNDLINIFCCNYSFAPYTIRTIKFLFFFHFLFYLETLCIGQKYYFDKYFSDEYQNFTQKMYNLTNNITNNNDTDINSNSTLNKYFLNYFSVETKELAKIHYLYTFKYSFPRVLIAAAISLISYIFTAVLSPRRKILKVYLRTDLTENEKKIKYKKISKNYKIIFIIFGFLALLLMGFFFYSITNYFVIFEDAKYDIPQSFLLSGLIRFIFDFLIWAIISNIRKLSIESHNNDFYGFVRIISEMN